MKSSQYTNLTRQSRTFFLHFNKLKKQDLMVNNSTRLVQIIATVLGLIESTCMMKEVNFKATFAIAGTTGMSK